MSGSILPPDEGASQNWKLVDGIAKDVQGVVVSGFGSLPFARAFFLDCANVPGGDWLTALREITPITAADGPQEPAAMIAFTHAGLKQLGVPQKALQTFQLPFQEGMMRDDRRNRLGDDDKASPNTITKGGLVWSGNEQQRATPRTVHALLILYAASEKVFDDEAGKVQALLVGHGLGVTLMELDLRLDPRGVAREHFGFSDGVSQPIPFDIDATVNAPAACRDPIHGVALGDVLLGYPNAHGEIPPGPVVDHPVAVDTTVLVATKALPKHIVGDDSRLPEVAGAEGLRDLGRNGSYLVVRELRQDVAGFWNSLDREATNMNERAGPDARQVDAEWLAGRVVGRDLDGHLLGPQGPWPPLEGGLPDNQPLFFKTDQFGFGCPIGSHVRRANPRDGLAMEPGTCGTLLEAANAHRILRRGRKFGPDATRDATGRAIDDGKDRGLLFMCLNTDIVRQFEFVQQNWLLNPNFGTLYKEVDPLVGPAGKMSLPMRPLRRTVDVETYVTLTGGEYFFLPSLGALSYFETLDGPAPTAPGMPPGAPT